MENKYDDTLKIKEMIKEILYAAHNTTDNYDLGCRTKEVLKRYGIID